MLYFVIVTLQEYKTPRDILLDSLTKCGIDSSQIILVFGKESEEYINVSTKEIHLKHNIYEYNAFIGVQKLIDHGVINKDDSFLLLHDTSKAGINFKSKAHKLYNLHVENQSDFTWAHNRGQCNICIFSSKGCMSVFRKFKDISTMDKKTAIKMEHDKDILSIKRIPLEHTFSHESAIVIGKEKIYSDVDRIVLYMPCLDLYKYYFDCGPNMDGAHPEKP